MADRALIPLLVTGMLVTGCSNTLLTKYQDLQEVSGPDGKHKMHFEQPVLQTLQMFVGESACWLIVGASYLWTVFVNKRNGYTPIPGPDTQGTAIGDEREEVDADGHAVRKPGADSESLPLKGWPVLLLALPAAADIAGTTLMNVGLLFVAASIYQMTRGALVLFVGVFSVIFLRHKLGPAKWFSLVIVVTGVALVGLAGALQKHPQSLPIDAEPELLAVRANTGAPEIPVVENEAVRTILGVLMIAGAQIFTATQFVLEEFILSKYSIDPVRCVGWEGVFGFLITFIGMVILHLTIGTTDAGKFGYFDAVEGWRQFTSYPAIFTSSILIMISIGGFNFFGMSVTRTISATSRSTIDTCRTLFIWIVSLGLGWERFSFLQVAGFILLVYGTFLFNDIVVAPWVGCIRKKNPHPPLQADLPIEHA